MQGSRRRRARIAPLLLIALTPGCSSPSAQPAQTTQAPRQQTAGAANPITVDSTEEQIRQAVATARVGRKLTPKAWAGGNMRETLGKEPFCPPGPRVRHI